MTQSLLSLGENLLALLCESLELKDLLQFRLVCREADAAVRSAQLSWKRLFIARWPLQNPQMKMRSWSKMYIRRAQKERDWKGNDPLEAIENCAWSFRCPLAFEELPGSGDRRTCGECNRLVVRVYDQVQLHEQIRAGNCVALKTEQYEEMGEICEPFEIEIN